MKNEIQKTTKILDELCSLLMGKGSTEIDVKLKLSDICTIIYITDYNTSLTQEEINTLSKFLNIPRQPEVEEYYWGLMGETNNDDEMFLLGSMLDTAQFDLKDGNLYVELVRSLK